MDALANEIFGLNVWALALVVVAFLASGVVRGFTGGIGSNFLTAPILSVLIGPREAVPIVVLLSMVGNAQLMPQVLPHVRWREGGAIFLFPVLFAPLGAWVLFTIEEDTMRRVIAGMAAAFSLLLLTGWRYRGRHMLGLSVATGSASGLLVGAISMGGPPIFLYLMAGPGCAVTNRAQFVMFGNFAAITALVSFAVVGAITSTVLLFVAFLLVPLMTGIWIGDRLFRRTGDELFRRLTLWGLVAVSLCVLAL